MMIKNNQNNQSRLVAILSIWVLMFAIAGVEHFTVHYKDIDNFIISNVINGVYSDQCNYSMHVHPMLSMIAKILRTFIPFGDVYFILNEFSILFAGYSLCASMAIFYDYDTKKVLCFNCLVFFFVLATDIINENFTIATSVMCCSAVIVLVVGIQTNNKMLFALSCVLYVISWLFRTESCELLLPYVMLALLFTIVQVYLHRNENSKRIAIIGLLTFLAIALAMLGSKILFINVTENKAGVAYNEARAQIVDYCEDSQSIMHLLMDTDGVDQEYLNNQYETEYKDKRITSSLTKAFLKLPRRILEGSHTTFLFICSLAVAGYVVLFSKSYLNWLVMASGLIGGEIMFVYFAIQGRAIERVAAVIMMGVMTICSVCFFTAKIKKNNKIKKILIFTYSILCVLFMRKEFELSQPQNAFMAMADNEYDIALEMGMDDSILIWDVFVYDTEVMKAHFFPKGKLYSRDFVRKNIIDGEWIYGQPFYNQLLKEIDMENPMKALFNESNVYYITTEENAELVKNYYDLNNEYQISLIGLFHDQYPIIQFVKTA